MVTNLTSILENETSVREDSGSIPGLVRRVEDPALPGNFHIPKVRPKKTKKKKKKKGTIREFPQWCSGLRI